MLYLSFALSLVMVADTTGREWALAAALDTVVVEARKHTGRAESDLRFVLDKLTVEASLPESERATGIARLRLRLPDGASVRSLDAAADCGRHSSCFMAPDEVGLVVTRIDEEASKYVIRLTVRWTNPAQGRMGRRLAYSVYDVEVSRGTDGQAVTTVKHILIT